MAKNIYSYITSKLVNLMQSNITPWRMSWGLDLPMNHFTKYEYRGINFLLLNAVASVNGWSNKWLTFNQLTKLKGRLVKGATGYPVLLWKFKAVNPDDPDEKPLPLLRYYTVFNLSETVHIPYMYDTKPVMTDDERFAECEKIIGNYSNKPRVIFGNYNPAYSRSDDLITMPERSKFSDPEEFYSTYFHEITHSTGHPTRLDRPLTANKKDYMKEELIAELGFAYLCAKAKISNKSLIENQAAYLKGWISAFEQDSTLIFKASTQAEKAVKLITQDWGDYYLEPRFQTTEIPKRNWIIN